jgi:cytochrome c553
MKKVVLALMVAGAVSLVSADGKAAFAKCAGCHGQDGKKKALNKSAVIAGQDAAKTVEQLKGQKNSYVAADDIVTGAPWQIPLWIFGMNY